MSNDKTRIEFKGNIDIMSINSFIKRHVGSMCYVSSMPKDKTGYVGIGILSAYLTYYSDLPPKVHIKKHDDVFKAFFEEGDYCKTFLVIPEREEIHERIEEYKSAIRRGNRRGCVEVSDK